VSFCLGLQWCPEWIAHKVGVSHEYVYLHVYADKAAGGNLHKNLRSQKLRRKRHLCWRDRRGQIPNRRPVSDRPRHIEQRKQVGHWERDIVIGAAHKQAIVTLVKRKSGFAVLAKVLHKSADLVGRAIEEKLKSFGSSVKTVTLDNVLNAIGVAQKEQAHSWLSQQPKKQRHFAALPNGHFHVLRRASIHHNEHKILQG
jgi:transposase, IS30 family